MTNDKEIKCYISEIKTLLPVCFKSERRFINNLKDSIYAFTDSHPDASMEDLIDQFGEPFEIVKGYISSMEVETLIKMISVRKMLHRIAAIILIAAIIGLTIFGGFYYTKYHSYKSTAAAKYESIVEND